MKIGTLVSHEGLLQSIGAIINLREDGTASVYFPQLRETICVFIDDLEVL